MSDHDAQRPSRAFRFGMWRPEPRVVEMPEIANAVPGVFVKVLPAGTYAVVTHRVLDGYAKLYGAFDAWLAVSDFEEAAPFDVQLYDARFTTMDDPASVQDVCIPIRRKRSV
jgi:DNA gyrase inhibitor GyrI